MDGWGWRTRLRAVIQQGRLSIHRKRAQTSMSLDFNRLEQILAEASAKADAAQRAAFLDEECGQDRELRAEVDRLLAAGHRSRTPAVVRLSR